MCAEPAFPTAEAIELLAPASGSGVGKQIAQRLLSRPDWLDLVENALVHALTAQSRFYDNATKSHVVMQDAKTQLAAVLGIWSHLEGDPIKRVIHERGGSGSSPVEDLEAALANSPALAAAVRRTLAKAERNLQIKRAEPVDLDP
jgi:hypothetical protein